MDVTENDSAAKLVAHISALEELTGEKQEIAEAMTDRYKMVKSDNFDQNVLKMILKRRKIGEGAAQVMDDLIETYEAALRRMQPAE